jgi:hypothetical protein
MVPAPFGSFRIPSCFYLTSHVGDGPAGPVKPDDKGGTDGGGEKGGISGFPGNSTGTPFGPDTYPYCPTL